MRLETPRGKQEKSDRAVGIETVLSDNVFQNIKYLLTLDTKKNSYNTSSHEKQFLVLGGNAGGVPLTMRDTA